MITATQIQDHPDKLLERCFGNWNLYRSETLAGTTEHGCNFVQTPEQRLPEKVPWSLSIRWEWWRWLGLILSRSRLHWHNGA